MLLRQRQQCRTSFALKFCPFDKVERCFDIVAQNGNIVEATGNKVACCFDIVAGVDRALVEGCGQQIRIIIIISVLHSGIVSNNIES